MHKQYDEAVILRTRRPHQWPSRAWSLAFLVASLGYVNAPPSVREAGTSSVLIDAVDPAPASRVTLPDGFSGSVDIAATPRFVRIVADDIDNDGDIDVVANVGTLDLLVWENDGAGHFSRWPSHQRSLFEAQPPEASSHNDLVAFNEGVQNDNGRVVRLARQTSVIDDQRGGIFSLPTSVVIRQAKYSVRSPRAPPPAFQL